MPLSNLNKEKVFFALKLAGAVIILYLGITYNVFDVGERLSDFLSKDFLEETGNLKLETGSLYTGNMVDQYINEAIQELQNQTGGHGAANVNGDGMYADRFEKICDSDSEVCQKIDLVGDYTDKEKYLYLSAIFSVVNFLNENLVVGDSIDNVINRITVDSSMGTRRGYATWSEIVFNVGAVVSRSEFVGLVAHEFGHIVDLGAMKGTSSNKHGSFTEFGKKVFADDDMSLDYYAMSWKSETIRKPSTTKKDFCSGYGMSDPFEDFAECFNLYINHNSLFKQLAKNNAILKKKYNYIANILDGKFIGSNATDLDYIKNNASWRPWDTTRISP